MVNGFEASIPGDHVESFNEYCIPANVLLPGEVVAVYPTDTEVAEGVVVILVGAPGFVPVASNGAFVATFVVPVEFIALTDNL